MQVRAGLSSAFAAVLAKGLQKRAGRRFQTGDEMASTLYACLVDGGYTLHPTPHTPHPAPYTLHSTPYTLHPMP